MAGLIFKAPYYKPSHRTADGRSRSGMLNYVATREGVEAPRSGMIGYVGGRKGSCGLFTDEGEEIVLSRIGKELDEHTGNMWGLIFSLKREDAERLGYNTADQWMHLLRAHRNDIAKSMNIAPENLRWYAAYHNKEKHPHVHMLVWSRSPREPYLSVEGIESIKSTIGHEIFRQDMISVYKEQTEARDKLKDSFRERMSEITLGIESGDFEIAPELITNLTQLAEKIKKHKGKKVYGYLDKNAKKLVNEIVKLIADDPNIIELYDLWQKCREEIFRTYTDEIPEKIPLEENKEFKSLRNMVVKVADSTSLPDQPPIDIDLDPEDDEDVLKILAERGDRIALYKLYRAYSDDIFESRKGESMKYLRSAVDAGFGFAEYKYAELADKNMPNVKLSYLLRAAEHGCFAADYEIGKLYYESGQTEQALKYLERAAERDVWSQTQLAMLYCYKLGEFEKGVEHLKIAAAEGYLPAQKALDAIEKEQNARIVVGICNLFYHASRIIEESADKYIRSTYDGIDSRQKREQRAKQLGIAMSGI